MFEDTQLIRDLLLDQRGWLEDMIDERAGEYTAREYHRPMLARINAELARKNPEWAVFTVGPNNHATMKRYPACCNHNPPQGEWKLTAKIVCPDIV